MPGVRTVLNLFPSENLAVVVLTNSETNSLGRVAGECQPDAVEVVQRRPVHLNETPCQGALTAARSARDEDPARLHR